MSEVISTGVWCPRCGRKEAVIEKEPLAEELVPSKKKSNEHDEKYARKCRISNQVNVTHPFCGYQQTLDSYLTYHVISSLDGSDIDIPALVERKLIVTNERDDISKSLKKALFLVNGYFSDYCYIHKNENICNLICPFCGGTTYSGLKSDIVCECKHYQIPAMNKIYSSVLSPFYLLPEKHPSLYPLKVVVDHPIKRTGQIRVCTIATVEFYYNHFKSQRIFLVSKKNDGSKTDYIRFLKALIKNTEPVFTIIEKV